MINIDDLVRNFIRLLNYYWKDLEVIIDIDHTGSLKEDWLQANWEILVEGPLNRDKKVYLQVYGDGADLNSISSRVIYPSALPTHSINCIPQKGNVLIDYLNQTKIEAPINGFAVDRFVSIGEDGWYYEKPPFDKILINNDTEVVLDIEALNFILVEQNRKTP